MIKPGVRVVVTGGAWSGEHGIFVGVEKTIIGILCKVKLDNGFSTLVDKLEIREEA
jgi:hypothetical protein